MRPNGDTRLSEGGGSVNRACRARRCGTMPIAPESASRMNIAFVIPIHNEGETLAELVAGIREHTGSHDYAIWLIDDGSTDGSTETISAMDASDDDIHAIVFERRKGKSAALAEAFHRVESDLIVTMDGDLQDRPSEIPKFIAKIEEGFDLVCGWKAVRHDPWHKTYPSRVYNGAVAWLFDLPLHDVNCGFKAMKTEVAKSIRITKGLHRLIPVLAGEKGFSMAEIEVEHQPRRFGRSKYGIGRFARGGLDVVVLWIRMKVLRKSL